MTAISFMLLLICDIHAIHLLYNIYMNVLIANGAYQFGIALGEKIPCNLDKIKPNETYLYGSAGQAKRFQYHRPISIHFNLHIDRVNCHYKIYIDKQYHGPGNPIHAIIFAQNIGTANFGKYL